MLIWVTAALMPAWAATAKVPDKTPSIRVESKMAFWWGDFDALEAQNALLRQPGHIAADGASELEQFRSGLNDILVATGPNRNAYLGELEALTLQWTTAHPKSAFAHALHAQVLLQLAWSYRGNGRSNEVPPQAWKDFAAYLRRAAEYLQANADVALTDSYAHATLLSIGRGMGWDRKQLWAIAQDGVKRNPQDIALYFNVLTSLLPKWGGDARTLDGYIREVAEQTKADYGMGMYARLYSAAAEADYDHGLFEGSHADWAKMKQGYQDMQTRYPNSPVRTNRFAYMACLAKDKVTLLALLEQLGPQVDAAEWGTNPERSLEVCQRLAREM